MKKAKELAIELKSWSSNISPNLNLSNTLETFKSLDNNDDSMLMYVHMSQL